MELTQRVEALITEINKTHKYSMSQIYGLYNEVFSLAETPQACASCLIRKTTKLKEWLNNQTKINIPTPQKEQPKKTKKIPKQKK